MHSGKNLGLAVKERMEASGLSLQRLARKAGITRVTLRAIVNGKTQNPGVLTLTRIARALDTTVGHLLGEVE